MKKFFFILTLSLITQGAYAWRCCQQGGGDAPGVFLTKNKCEKAGYVVKNGLNASCGSATGAFIGAGNGVVLCAKNQVHPIISIVTSYAATNGESSDKFQHCATSCILKKRCGSIAAWGGGHGKEIKDLFDRVRGNSYGSGDNDANRKGRQIAEIVTSENGCLESCGKAY